MGERAGEEDFANTGSDTEAGMYSIVPEVCRRKKCNWLQGQTKATTEKCSSG